MTPGPVPNLRLERSWLAAGHAAVAGSDEVGRGALGGPVSAGVVVVDGSTRRQPSGLRDSKLLAAQAREALVPRIERWAVAWAVGHASAAEIDAIGILRALRLAGERALSSLPQPPPQLVLLDGNYDWFTRPLPFNHLPVAAVPGRVELRVKADLAHASVAAASVLAKVARDHLMEDLALSYPDYGWDENKGYATPRHTAALIELGPCVEHRRSWRFRCLEAEQLALGFDDEPALAESVLSGGALNDPWAGREPARR